MQLGDELSIMQIGKRQLAARSPAHKGRRTTRIKVKSRPQMTPFIAEVWAKFAEAASSAYGGTMEQVNQAVAGGLTGLDTGAKLYHEEDRRIKHEQTTPRNIRIFREAAAHKGAVLGFTPRSQRYERVPEYERV